MNETPSVHPYLHCAAASTPRWTNDGGSLAFLSNLTGNWELFRVAVAAGDGPGWPDRLTFFGDRVGEVHPLAGRADEFLVLADQGGDERWRLLRVSPGAVVDLDPGEGLMRHLARPAADGDRFAFSSNRRSPDVFDVYLGSIAGDAAPSLLWQRDALLYPLSFAPDGQTLLVRETRPSRDQVLWLVPVQGGEPRPLAQGPEGQVSQFATPAWAPNGRTLYAVSDAAREFSAVVALDLASGNERTLYAPEADVEEIALSPDGRRLALCENVRGRTAVRLLDVESLDVRTLLAEDGVISSLSWAPDGSERLALHWDRPARGQDLYVLDASDPAPAPAPVTRLPLGGIDAASLVAPEEVRVEVRDGLTVPAFFYRPQEGDAPYPAVWIVHGGPEGQSRDGFDAVAQFLLACGIAVVKPNVRGSTGYGRAYEHADDVRKRLDSVDDLRDLVVDMAARGMVDPARQAVMGGSYGGFMTLSTLTRHPDLWRAGVDIVGIADLVAFLEHTSPWRRPVREAEYGSLAHDRDFLREVSPLTHVDNIRAPLMVVHGARDPRVPVGESETIVAHLRQRGREVDYLRYEDEGHGLTKLINRIDAYGRIAAFLVRHLIRG